MKATHLSHLLSPTSYIIPTATVGILNLFTATTGLHITHKKLLSRKLQVENNNLKVIKNKNELLKRKISNKKYEKY